MWKYETKEETRYELGVSVDVDMSPPIFSHRMEGDVRIVVDACVWCGCTRSIERCVWMDHRSSMRQMQWAGLQIEIVDRCGIEESGRWDDRPTYNMTVAVVDIVTHKKNRATYTNKHPSIGIAITPGWYGTSLYQRSLPLLCLRRVAPSCNINKHTYQNIKQKKSHRPTHCKRPRPLSVFETDWNLPLFNITYPTAASAVVSVEKKRYGVRSVDIERTFVI